MILECKFVNNELKVITRAHGNVYDHVDKPTDGGIIAVIDPKARVIGMCLYVGVFTIIPLDKDSAELRATRLRFSHNILKVQFYH